ncbi:MAG: hypothetical protein WBI01_11065 [Syntrophomonadaceae bacterium]
MRRGRVRVGSLARDRSGPVIGEPIQTKTKEDFRKSFLVLEKKIRKIVGTVFRRERDI